MCENSLDYTKIGIGDIVYDIHDIGNTSAVRIGECMIITNSEIMIKILDDNTVISYHISLFNEKFFTDYNKAMNIINCNTISKILTENAK